MISPSSAQTNDLRPPPPLKIASIFQRHQVKFLNLGLVIYLCFGVLLFESLGEFNVQNGPTSIPKSDIGRPAPPAARNSPSKLVEMRELSARRMWNITNRLNILYESNWTRLMLDELQEFERQLLDKLAEEALAYREQEEKGDEDEEEEVGDDDDEDSDQEKREKKKKKQSERDSKKRLKSLKKSLIHSLSTITTVGFTQRIESSAGKLATVIYGLLGVPLLFCSVAKTGKQVAHSTRNGLLILRHYCFSLPVHYLCCSCSLAACFRCLLRCCCCCCCSYLCCCLMDKQRRGNKNKCCDPSKAPKLRFRPRRGRGRSPDGASHSSPRQAAFVIGATSRSEHDAAEQQLALAAAPHQQQKSVRFEGQNAKHKKRANKDHADDYEREEEEEEKDNHEDDLSYTRGVFFTSLSALSLYLLLGAYFYATYTDGPLIDALFVCYSLLSTSKFTSSNSADGQQIYSNPRILYQHLNASGSSSSSTQTSSNFQATGESIESETVKWIYLLVGLNLVSACGHFAQLWLSDRLKLEECPLASSDKKKQQQQQQPICNGQQIIHGSYQMSNENHDTNQQAAPPIGGVGGGGELQLVASQIMTPTGFVNHQPAYQQQSDQVDLSELFLVQNHQAAVDGSSPENNGMPFVTGQLQPASDVSLTSDRSTDRGSLCHHHHHHHQHQHQMQQSAIDNLYQSHNSIYNNSNSNTAGLKQHHRHPSQGHLYLPSALGCAGADQQQMAVTNHQFIPELDCEESVEMDLMLKSCMQNGAKLRSSSSSAQLSSHPIGGSNHQHHLPGTTNNSRLSFDKQNGGQDCSLNDGSNTMSSTTSSRTVKLPHMRSNQHIGFILAPEQQANLNKQ